jgi:hypothetical protein
VREGCKGAEKFKKEEEDAAKRAKNLEEAKGIVIKEDVSLPKAKLIKIADGTDYRGSRVEINGWVHRLRRQGIAYCCTFVSCQFSNTAVLTGSTAPAQFSNTAVLTGSTAPAQFSNTAVWTGSTAPAHCKHINCHAVQNLSGWKQIL